MAPDGRPWLWIDPPEEYESEPPPRSPPRKRRRGCMGCWLGRPVGTTAGNCEPAYCVRCNARIDGGYRPTRAPSRWVEVEDAPGGLLSRYRALLPDVLHPSVAFEVDRKHRVWRTDDRRTPRWHWHSPRIADAVSGRGMGIRVLPESSLRWVMIDLDGPTALDDLSLVERVLGSPAVLLHSPRYYQAVWGCSRTRAVDALAGVVQALRAAGVEVRPGRVEVFPDPSRPVRLPLAGSVVVDRRTGRVVGAGHSRTDRRAQLAAFVEAVAGQSIELPKSNAFAQIKHKIGVGDRGRGRRTAEHAPPACCSDFPSSSWSRAAEDRVLACGFDLGRRYEQAGWVVRRLVRDGAGSAEDVAAEVEEWLRRTGGGASFTLAAGGERAFRAQVSECRRYAARVLAAWKACGGRRVERVVWAAPAHVLAEPDEVVRGLAVATWRALSEAGGARALHSETHWIRHLSALVGAGRARREYVSVRAAVARLIGAVRAGGYRVGHYATTWVLVRRESLRAGRPAVEAVVWEVARVGRRIWVDVFALRLHAEGFEDWIGERALALRYAVVLAAERGVAA